MSPSVRLGCNGFVKQNKGETVAHIHEAHAQIPELTP